MIDTHIIEVIQHLDHISQDKALFHQFLRQNPDFTRWCEIISDRQHQASAAEVTPLPALETITALQTTVFDNWKHSKKGKFQYAVQITAFTTDTVKNWRRPNWKGTAKMWPAAEAVKTAKKSKSRLSDATLSLVEEISANGGYVGIFQNVVVGVGSPYVDQHLVWVKAIDGVNTEVMLYTPNCACWVAPFDTCDSRGNALTENVLIQSRSSDHERFEVWATGAASPL